MKKTKVLKHMLFNKKVFWSLLFLILLMSCTYGLLIGKIITNVVARQNIQKNLTALSSQVSNLEATYLTLQDSVNIDTAYAMGFKDVNNSDTQYITSNPSGQNIAMRQTQ
jgi:hypothetical protein